MGMLDRCFTRGNRSSVNIFQYFSFLSGFLRVIATFIFSSLILFVSTVFHLLISPSSVLTTVDAVHLAPVVSFVSLLQFLFCVQ